CSGAGRRPFRDLSPSVQAGLMSPAEAAPQPGAGSSQTMTTLVVNPKAAPTSSVPGAPAPSEASRPAVLARPGNWLALAAVAVGVTGAAFLLTRRAVALRR